MSLRVNPIGPHTAKIMVVGDYPNFAAEISGIPFSDTGESLELQRQFREVGIRWDECWRTYAYKERPSGELNDLVTDKKKTGEQKGFVPFFDRWVSKKVVQYVKELENEIAACNPDIIVGLGNFPLYCLTGNWGVANWRGSQLVLPSGHRFVPTYDPASILKNWELRAQVIHDLRVRVLRPWDNPNYSFNTAPTFDEVMQFLHDVRDCWVAGDVETSNGHILCLGLAVGPQQALCIPFRNEAGVYWDAQQQTEILAELRRFCERDGIYWVGQNWNYDAQYFDEDFGWTRMVDFDTYIAQSVLFPGSERKLGYLSSMYCSHHVYWKEDGKDWWKKIDFQKLFRYNCLDVCRDWEIAQVQHEMLLKAGLLDQFKERIRYSHTVYRMMRRGVHRCPQRTAKMVQEVADTIHARELEIAEIAGHPVNFASPKQVGDLLYKEMGLTPYKGKSTDNDTLKKLTDKFPKAKPLCDAILEARSLTSIKSTFLEAELDPDGRFRSSFMATGTETFRLTSSGNAFYRGGPLQNVTDGKHTHSGRKLPNLRSTIIPDPGYTCFNCDLQRADLQVVVWEADDVDLKAKLREGADIHTENAKDVFGLNRAPTEQERHFGKTFVHLTNYGGGARTCAIKVGCTVHQADLMQRRWFAAHPGIKRWHQRVAASLWGTRTVRNVFGYRRVYFDRLEGLLPQALAWGPQSTIGLYISLIQMAWETELGEQAPIDLQMHDSLKGQYKTELEGIILPKLYAASQITIPYDDPLIIPLDLATSTSSWGEVEKRAWPV